MRCTLALLMALFQVPAIASWMPLKPVSIDDAAISLDDHPAYALPRYDDSDWARGDWASVSERGVWWLRSRIELPADYRESDTAIGLYIQAAASAEIWWNGERIGRSGRVGDTPSSERPGRIDSVFALPQEARDPGPHLLAIRFSSQHLGTGVQTPVDGLFLAPYGPPTRFLQERYRPGMILGGSLFLAFGFLAVVWRRDRRAATGWLLLACGAALLQLALEISRAFFPYPYPLHELRLSGIAVTAALGGVSLVGHLVARFELPKPGWWIMTAAIMSIIVLLTQSRIGTATIAIIATWILIALAASILAAARQRRSSWAVLTALTIMLAWLWTDPASFTDRNYFLVLVVLLLLFFADTVRRHARAQQARNEAERRSDRLDLELLKRQLRPHFLLNTLTTIQEWLETDPHAASEMIDALAREFRMLDRMADQRLVTLDEELALCRAHLEVMSHRREQKYELQVSGKTDLLAPPATLHTLLENAITHCGRHAQEQRFTLEIQRGSRSVTLTLSTPLAAGDAQVDFDEGKGLTYVRARLREAFGDRARIESGPAGPAWRTVLQLPAPPISATEPDGAAPA